MAAMVLPLSDVLSTSVPVRWGSKRNLLCHPRPATQFPSKTRQLLHPASSPSWNWRGGMGITKEMAHLATTARWEVPPGRERAGISSTSLPAAGVAHGAAAAQKSSKQAEDVSDAAIILEPVSRRDIETEVLLLFVPGALTDSDAYLPVANAIQAGSNFRLWIAILGQAPPLGATPEWVEESLDSVLKIVKERGFSGTKVFIGGHSWGAWQSRTVALRRSDGFIQTGSCFWGNPDNLAQYPKPVLTITGELDGQITVATGVAHAWQILETEPDLGAYNTVAIKPVVIIQGMNHAQVSHGRPNKDRGDLDAEIPIEEARAQVAEAISSFLALNSLRDGDSLWEQSLAALTRTVRATENRYRPFWEAINQQGKGPEQWQLKVAGVPGLEDWKVSVVQHDYVDNFVYSKPSIVVKENRIIVHTYLKALKSTGIVSNIWVKMKSSEAVTLLLGHEVVKPDTKRLAASFNDETFAKALQLVPEDSQNKFLERGKKLRFIHDLLFTSGQDWVDSDLTIQDSTDGSGLVDVQTPILVSGVEGVPPRFAGMHYMKLMTVARAIQWILVDSFR